MRFVNKKGMSNALTSGDGMDMMMKKIHNLDINLSHEMETRKEFRPDISEERKRKDRNDLAYNYQLYMEDQVVEYLDHLHELYPDIKKICLAGGLFGNVKLNQRINELDR